MEDIPEGEPGGLNGSAPCEPAPTCPVHRDYHLWWDAAEPGWYCPDCGWRDAFFYEKEEDR